MSVETITSLAFIRQRAVADARAAARHAIPSAVEINQTIRIWKAALSITVDNYISPAIRDEHGLDKNMFVYFNEQSGRIEAECLCCFKIQPLDRGPYSFERDFGNINKHLKKHRQDTRTIAKSKLLL
jgi:hypothetical protein